MAGHSKQHCVIIKLKFAQCLICKFPSDSFGIFLGFSLNTTLWICHFFTRALLIERFALKEIFLVISNLTWKFDALFSQHHWARCIFSMMEFFIIFIKVMSNMYVNWSDFSKLHQFSKIRTSISSTSFSVSKLSFWQLLFWFHCSLLRLNWTANWSNWSQF